jgi:hypothetical protein
MGGSEKVSKVCGISQNGCVVAIAIGTVEMVAAAVAPSVHETRQPVMESDPFGQQGQSWSPAGIGISSQARSAAVAPPECAKAMAGTARNSCAAITT